MKKNNFKNPAIEEHAIDPLTHVLIKQNKLLKKENKKLKDSATTEANSSVELGNLRFDLMTHKVFYKDQDLLLANREYDVLLYLANHANENVSFEELGTAIFGSYLDTDKKSIMVIISRLRKKMQVDIYLENMLENIRGVGYKLVYSAK